jgi:GTP cyclohydrolase IA
VSNPQVGNDLSQANLQQLQRLEALLREVLEILGEDLSREGLQRTPGRWAESLLSTTAGLRQDPAEHLSTLFHLEQDESGEHDQDLILVENIEFSSTCEHHMAPFRGVMHVGYIPHPARRVVGGLSKFSRVVDVFARRPQMQERLTQQVAEAIHDCLQPLGVMVVAQAVHYCMICRGVEQHHCSTTTTARRGVFAEDSQLELKFQQYLSLRLETSNF